MATTKLIIISLIIIGIIFPYPINTPSANADVIVDTLKCLGGTTVGLVIQSAVTFVGNWVSKLLGGPTFTIEVQNINKEYILDVTERCFARAVLDNTIASLLNTARSKGRDGGETWVKNWRNFQLNAEYRGENIFRTILANTKLCNYIEQDIRDVFGVTDKFKQALTGQNIRSGDADPFTLKARCSMPDNFDIGKYKEDFAGNGGWERLVQLARPENNFYGALLESLEEQEKQKAIEVAADINEATGAGYTGIRGDSAASSCLVKSPSGRCIFYANIKSPAGYVSDVAGATINAEFDWVTAVDEYKELVVTALAKRLTDRLLNLGSSESDPNYDTNQVPHKINPTPPPGYITPTPFPGPGPNPPPGGSCEPEPNGCILNTIQNTCVNSVYGGDVNGAINAVQAEGTGLESPGSNVITNLDTYHNAVVQKVRDRGFTANHGGEELELKKNNSLSEGWDISATPSDGSPTIRRFHASTCEPAAF